MNIEFEEIAIPSVEVLLRNWTSASADDIAKVSAASIFASDIVSVWYGPEMLCIFALIPPTVLADEAYIWMYWTPAVERHKLIFARRSRSLVAALLDKYSTLIGHCFVPASRPWLLSVGATFRSETEFVISR